MPITGKIDYFSPPLTDSKSAAWEFFTDDHFGLVIATASGVQRVAGSNTGNIGRFWIASASPRNDDGK
jgi:hypothetical protein